MLASSAALFAGIITAAAAAQSANGVDGYVDAVAVVAGGKIVIAGQFTTVDGLKRPSLARLLPDGRLDASFNPALSATSRVDALAAQADGKLIVAGYFPDVQAPGGGYSLLRLNADGSRDAVPAQPDGSPGTVFIQSDGKILIGGGSVEYVGNQPRLHIARLNSDLTLDPIFQPSVAPDSDIYGFDEQTDGDVVIAGRFETIADPSQEIFAASVARVDFNGNVDAGFMIPMRYQGTSAYSVYQARVLASGDIIAAGYYDLTDVGTTTTSLHNSDGSLDNIDFTPATLGGPTALTVQTDGKILLGGVFSQIGNASSGLARNNIGRLNANGNPDSQFVAETNTGPAGQVIAMTEEADGSIVVGGAFTEMDGQTRNGITRLLSTGTLDPTFNVTDDIFPGNFDP
jgi:uncharacterized delta-60 repeat protein